MKKKIVFLLIIVMYVCYVGGMPMQNNKVQAATIKMNKKKVTLYVGESLKLKVKGTVKKIKWKSSNKKIVSVTSKGKVKAKKKGKVTITAKVGKKKLTCKVIVKESYNQDSSQNNNALSTDIEYLSDRSVEYDSLEKVHRVFFSLKTKDMTRVSAAGTANIVITNDNNEVVYDKAIRFYSSNFSYWTSKSYGTRYLCCIEIPDADIIPGKEVYENGILELSVELDSHERFLGLKNIIEYLPYKNLKINLIYQNYTEIHHGYFDNWAVVSDVEYNTKGNHLYIRAKVTQVSTHGSYNEMFLKWKLTCDGEVIKDRLLITPTMQAGEFCTVEMDVIIEEGKTYNLTFYDIG